MATSKTGAERSAKNCRNLSELPGIKAGKNN